MAKATRDVGKTINQAAAGRSIQMLLHAPIACITPCIDAARTCVSWCIFFFFVQVAAMAGFSVFAIEEVRQARTPPSAPKPAAPHQQHHQADGFAHFLPLLRKERPILCIGDVTAAAAEQVSHLCSCPTRAL